MLVCRCAPVSFCGCSETRGVVFVEKVELVDASSMYSWETLSSRVTSGSFIDGEKQLVDEDSIMGPVGSGGERGCEFGEGGNSDMGGVGGFEQD